jgi:hypothetical protein
VLLEALPTFLFFWKMASVGKFNETKAGIADLSNPDEATPKKKFRFNG